MRTPGRAFRRSAVGVAKIIGYRDNGAPGLVLHALTDTKYPCACLVLGKVSGGLLCGLGDYPNALIDVVTLIADDVLHVYPPVAVVWAVALVMAIVYPSTFILAISEYFTKKNVDVRVLFVYIVHIDVQHGSVISY